MKDYPAPIVDLKETRNRAPYQHSNLSVKVKEKIAIIGSGISGLSAAYFLSNKYDVHLYEKNNRLGGHTRTLYIVMSQKNSL